MKRTAILAIAYSCIGARLFVACGGSNDSTPSDGNGPSDASIADGADASPGTNPNCPDTGDAPTTFACTGLYSDIVSKTIAPGVRAYSPAVPLWADGAEKDRWIALPDGTTIDATSPSEWSFPVGTRAWKEFRVGGKRVETRFFVKLRPTYWAHATYVWNADESDAIRSYASNVNLTINGAPYHVPSPTECDQCHKGRTDRLLGFEAVGLGLPGATGLTLETLVAEGRISPAPAGTLAIGDDGTGAAAPALAWLHVNCGVSCHNGNSNASGYGTGLRLRLDPTKLDGQPAAGWDSLVTTENAPATSPAWNGEIRIVPGDPASSLLVKLAGTRTSDGQGQMPPIASRVVDAADLAAIEDWIRKMPHVAPPDAGPPDAGPTDAGPTDAGSDAHDGGDASDAGTADASDAGTPDATTDAGADAGTDAGSDATDGDATPPDPGDSGDPADAGAADGAADDAGDDGGSADAGEDDADAAPTVDNGFARRHR